MDSKQYVFWLFDWDVIPVHETRRFYPALIKCEVETEKLILALPEGTLYLPLQDIVDVERYEFVQSLRAGSAANLKMTLSKDVTVSKRWFTRNELYLVPMHVFSEIPQRSYYEIDDLVKLIQDLKAGRTPSIHHNPYYRELQRQNRLSEFSEEKWQATTPPNEYTHFVTSKRAILTVIAVVLIGFPLFLAIAAIIFNVIMPWLQGR